jgi:SAM-dependent methyltransferase
VLLLGPLYHLPDPAGRNRALREALRVLRPGGLLFAAAVSRFASLFDGLAKEYLFDPAFRAIFEHDLVTGVHHNPDRHPQWWTTAYLHRPDEFADEIRAAGFEPLELVGVEGLAHWLPHLAARWDNPDDRKVILDAARLIENDPAAIGISSHFLAVAQRPA